MTQLPASNNAPNVLPAVLASSAQELLAEADRHAERTLQNLLATSQESAPIPVMQAHEEARAWLRTDFLFPHLSRWQKGLLVTLYWQSRMLTSLVNAPQRKLPAPLRSQTERLTRASEQAFMGLVRETAEAIDVSSFSPAQQMAFEQEYARIRFAEPVS